MSSRWTSQLQTIHDVTFYEYLNTMYHSFNWGKEFIQRSFGVSVCIPWITVMKRTPSWRGEGWGTWWEMIDMKSTTHLHEMYDIGDAYLQHEQMLGWNNPNWTHSSCVTCRDVIQWNVTSSIMNSVTSYECYTWTLDVILKYWQHTMYISMI